MSRYQLASFADRAPGISPLTRLVELCFARYPGVMVADERHMAWYLRRPGLDPHLSGAAWLDDTLVANVFVTVVEMSLAGSRHRVAVVDTVMVDPEHRGRGLARDLLGQTAEQAAERHLAAVQLYTTPGSPGYHLYLSLGFLPYRDLSYWERPPGAAADARPEPWSLARPDEWRAVAALIEGRAQTHDGVPALPEPAWRWRKAARPAHMPADVWRAGTDGAPEATLTAAEVDLTGGLRQIVLSDVVAGDGAEFAALCRHIGQRLPLVALADDADEPLKGLLGAAGFAPGQQEAAMLLPLRPELSAGRGSRRPWFPLIESIVGC